MTLEEKVLALRLFVMHRARGLGSVTEACRQLGISRTLFNRWRERYLRYGADGLKPRPPRRARPLQQARPEVEGAVLAYARLWPTHGPARIASQLLWRCAFRRTYYTAVAPMQRDLDRYLKFYNFERAHQGYRLQGRRPAEVFHARS